MLRTLERERSKLLLEEEVLKMQIAESQALERLNQDSVVQVMAPAIKLLYTNADTTMARSSLEQ
jgi:mannose/fructose/N-acetylgalactosamine-specific phosphotransferase system component IID